MQETKPTVATKAMKNRRASSKERKMVLQQDVQTSVLRQVFQVI